MVVLCKPGCPNYSVYKVFHLIALLNIYKLTSAVIANQLTHTLESNNLLPDTHFSSHLGRSTINSLYLFEATVKDAWWANKVASILLLDIEGAFPNAVMKHLLHNMCNHHIP